LFAQPIERRGLAGAGKGRRDPLEARAPERHRGDDQDEEPDQQREQVGIADQPELVLGSVFMQRFFGVEHGSARRQVQGRLRSCAIRPSVVPTRPVAGATRASPVSTSSCRLPAEALAYAAAAAVLSRSAAEYCFTASGASRRISSCGEDSAISSASAGLPRRSSAPNLASSSPSAARELSAE